MSSNSFWALTDSTDFDLESISSLLTSSILSDLDRACHDLDSSVRNRRRELRKFKETVKQLNRQLWFTRLVVVVLGVFVLCLALGLSRKRCTVSQKLICKGK